MRGDDKRENWLLIKEKDAEARANGRPASSWTSLPPASRPAGRWTRSPPAESDSPAKPAKAAKTQDCCRAQKALLTWRAIPEVQLATLVDEPPEGEQWVHEIKFDGYRLLGFVSGGAVAPAHAQRQ